MKSAFEEAPQLILPYTNATFRIFFTKLNVENATWSIWRPNSLEMPSDAIFHYWNIINAEK